MTRTYRRILFYALVLIFLPLAGWLALLAQGFTIKGSTLVEQGAIFLRGSPAGATVYINGSPYDSPAGFFRTQVFITNLRPGDHRVVLIRDGYHRWEKTLPVTPLTVTEASTIRLFPRAPQIEAMAHYDTPLTQDRLPVIGFATTTEALTLQEEERRRITEFASSTLIELGLSPEPTGQELLVSPDQRKVLIKSPTEILVVWLQKELVNGLHPKGFGEAVVSGESAITDALWLPGDSYHVLFATAPTETEPGKIKIAELDGRGGRNVAELLEAENVRFFIDPGTQNTFFTNGTTIFKITL